MLIIVPCRVHVRRHVTCTESPQTWLLSTQALVANTNNLSLDRLLGECRLEQAADCKLLFMRAATAAGLMQSEQALWPKIKAAVEGADQR